MMTNTVRHTFHSIGDRGGDIAKALGSGTVDLAKWFGGGTAGIARRVGPKRALIGLAVVGVAIGSIVLVRYLRARSSGDDLERDGDKAPGDRAMSRSRARAQHRAEAAGSH